MGKSHFEAFRENLVPQKFMHVNHGRQWLSGKEGTMHSQMGGARLVTGKSNSWLIISVVWPLILS